MEKDACHWLLACTQRHTDKHTHMHILPHTHTYTYTKNTERRDFIKSLLGLINSLKVLSWTTWLRVWHALVHPLTSKWDTVILPCFCGTQKDKAPCCESVTRLAGEELGLKPGLPQGFSVRRLIHFKGVFLDKKIEGQHLQFLGWLWSSGSIRATTQEEQPSQGVVFQIGKKILKPEIHSMRVNESGWDYLRSTSPGVLGVGYTLCLIFQRFWEKQNSKHVSAQ